MLIPDLELIEVSLIMPGRAEDYRERERAEQSYPDPGSNIPFSPRMYSSQGNPSKTPWSQHGNGRSAWVFGSSDNVPAASWSLPPYPGTSHGARVGSLFKDLLEDILEAPVVSLEDGVLGAHVERPLLLNGILEAAVSKA